MDRRTVTALIFLAIIFAAVFLGGWILGLFLLVLIYLGMNELITMMRSKNLYPAVISSYFGSFLFVTMGCLNKINLLYQVTALTVILCFFAILFRGKNARIKDIGASLICIMYGGFLPAHFLFLRNISSKSIDLFGYDLNQGLAFVVLMISCITVTDVGAYFIGCKFGKHKLWEAISPKKTIEGALGGVACSIVFALIVGYLTQLTFLQSLFAGIIITIFAQLGDLLESMMKRDAGAKDASDILPGHGGFLDRADSYIFTVVVVYYYFYYIVINPVF